MAQLQSLLTYEAPGWLVDAAVITPHALPTNLRAPESALDVTGMFVRDASHLSHDDDGPSYAQNGDNEGEGEEEFGIAGLGDSPQARKLQLIVLRETCLREVVFMLVEVLKTTGRHAECVRLADLVATSEYGIFKVSVLLYHTFLYLRR